MFIANRYKRLWCFPLTDNPTPNSPTIAVDWVVIAQFPWHCLLACPLSLSLTHSLIIHTRRQRARHEAGKLRRQRNTPVTGSIDQAYCSNIRPKAKTRSQNASRRHRQQHTNHIPHTTTTFLTNNIVIPAPSREMPRRNYFISSSTTNSKLLSDTLPPTNHPPNPSSGICSWR